MNIEPCMFCGSPAEINRFPGAVNHYVHCMNEDCWTFGPNAHSKEQAIAAWNDVARIVREHRESNDRA